MVVETAVGWVVEKVVVEEAVEMVAVGVAKEVLVAVQIVAEFFSPFQPRPCVSVAPEHGSTLSLPIPNFEVVGAETDRFVVVTE